MNSDYLKVYTIGCIDVLVKLDSLLVDSTFLKVIHTNQHRFLKQGGTLYADFQLNSTNCYLKRSIKNDNGS